MRKRILLIEDEPLVARMYDLRLQMEDFDVEWVIDGAAGWAALARRPPDAIILDLMIPKIDGLALLKKIRGTPAFAQIPVVIFTSNFLPALIEDAKQSGANACLSKLEVGPKQMIRLLRSLIEEAPQKSTKSAEPAPVPSEEGPEELLAACRRQVNQLGSSVVQLLSLRANETHGGLEQLLPRVHSIASQAAVLEAQGVARLASALEALVKQLVEQPDQITASTLRTVGQAGRFLECTFQKDSLFKLKLENPTALVVDDELFGRKAAQMALEKAGLQFEAHEFPVKAAQRLQETRFDVIVSDLNMPALNGFELCKGAKHTGPNRTTPFVLVTALDGFENRMRSAQTGVDDFIAKPFLLAELGLKVLILILDRDRVRSDQPFQAFRK